MTAALCRLMVQLTLPEQNKIMHISRPINTDPIVKLKIFSVLASILVT